MLFVYTFFLGVGGGGVLRGYYLIKDVFINYVIIDSSIDSSNFYSNHKTSFLAKKLVFRIQ